MKRTIILSLVAVIYIIFSLAIQSLSFGPIQFRLGEMLLVLPFINKKYSISLILGCFIVNLYSTLGIVDIFFGTFSTFLMCFFITRVSNKWLIPIIAGFLTGSMIGLELHLVFGMPLLVTSLTVGAGELITVVVGVLIFNIIENKYPYFYQQLKDI